LGVQHKRLQDDEGEAAFFLNTDEGLCPLGAKEKDLTEDHFFSQWAEGQTYTDIPQQSLTFSDSAENYHLSRQNQPTLNPTPLLCVDHKDTYLTRLHQIACAQSITQCSTHNHASLLLYGITTTMDLEVFGANPFSRCVLYQ